MNAKTGALLLTGLVLAAVGPLDSQAQNAQTHGDTRKAHDEAAQVHAEAAAEGRANDRINNDPDLNNDQSPRKDRGHGPDDRATGLHRAHPHASARCHDGFFTTTRDRGHACTRHGGIDVWLTG